ncbi:MAG: hypothetical protein Q8O71_01160, partial [bacterium]|nr:hypothetical protein [bacterium]
HVAGRQVFLTTDSKVYRNTGTGWTAAVPAVDITGQMTDAQIADLAATKISGQLTAAQIASIASTQITGQMTDAQIADLAATKISGQLTDAQIADIAAAKITGQVVAAQIADATLTTAQFAASIRPVEILGALPGPPHVAGRMVFLTTDGKVYRNTGTGWTAAVPAVDVTGQMTDAQIADLAATKISGQLTAAQIADIASTQITGQMTNAQIADLAATKISGQLTDAQIADIAAAKITGQVVAAQIADATLTTAEFAASIKPVEVLAALPGAPHVAGRMVFLTTDSKVYRNTGTGWTAAVPAVDVTGQMTDAQIADLAATKISGQLTAAQIASIASTQITGQMTDAQIADLAATKISGQLTDAQIADIAAAKITGQVVAAQIADATLTTAEFAASIKPVEVLAALPGAPHVAGRQVFLTTDSKVYRNTGTGWTAAVPAVDITGQMTDAQIADLAAT